MLYVYNLFNRYLPTDFQWTPGTDAILSLLLLAMLLLLSARVGRWIGSRWSIWPHKAKEEVLWALPLGLGIVAYGLFALGVLGWFRWEAFGVWLLILAVFSWRAGWGGWEILPDFGRAWLRWARASVLHAWLALMLWGLGLLTLFQSLTPPWDYDGLMYHLQGPRIFLEQGQIVLYPENIGANGPFTLEMLFSLGLSVGLESFAKLVHLTYAVLVLGATAAFMRRFAPQVPIWTAVVLLLGMPILPAWASWAYIDIGWALYEFLAVYALFLWRDEGQQGWLWLSGMMAGLALGTKYLALGGVATMGIWLLLLTWRWGWRCIGRQVFSWGVVALIVASPWYLKNWLLAGNPLYPYFWGGPGWPHERLVLYMDYMEGFGVGHSWMDLLLLPWHIYVNHENFTTLLGSIEYPNILFPFALLMLLVRPVSRWMRHLGVLFIIRFVFWAAGSQQIRLMMPLFPMISVLTAYAMYHFFMSRLTAPRAWTLLYGLLQGALMVSLIYSILYWRQVQPLKVLLGLETRAQFLQRMGSNYYVMQYIQEHLDPQTRVLMLWDGRGYYCNEQCLPDASHTRWTYLVVTKDTMPAILHQLRSMGVTHLLVTPGNVYFNVAHDSGRSHRYAWAFFENEFRPLCTQEIYRDHWARLYRITCSADDGTPSSLSSFR